MKFFFFFLTCIIFISEGAYSQKCDCYRGADSTWQVVPMLLGTDTGTAPHYQCNDCSSLPIALPFNFCFYGKEYDTLYINNKGSISFGFPVYNFTNVGLHQGADTAMLAAFLADVDNLLTPGEVYYKVTPTHLIVQWNTVGYQVFDDDLFDNFQMIITNGADSILPQGNNVSYCYKLMDWASGDSIGAQEGGFFGVPAKVGVVKGDGIHFAQFGTFNYHGYEYYGPYDTNSELYWLDNQSFTFNTCVTANNIPPVIINPDLCNTFTLCAPDTLTFSALFLNSEQGQKSTLSVSAPGLSGITTDTSSQYSIDSITVQLIATLSDTGTHTVTITATDNSLPPLTNARNFKITVNPCGDTAKKDTSEGIKNIANYNNFTIYPNPNKGKFIIQSSVVSRQWSVIIYNVLGEQVYSQFNIQSSTFNIDLSGQPNGVYFYRIITGKGNLLGDGKLVIQK